MYVYWNCISIWSVSHIGNVSLLEVYLLYWKCISTKGICLLEVYLYGEYICIESISLLQMYLFWKCGSIGGLLLSEMNLYWKFVSFRDLSRDVYFLKLYIIYVTSFAFLVTKTVFVLNMGFTGIYSIYCSRYVITYCNLCLMSVKFYFILFGTF